jgi:hypothetical protein
MVFGGFQKSIIVGYSGCSIFLQTLHLLFVVYEQKEGTVEGFIYS